MLRKKPKRGIGKLNEIIAEARRNREQRLTTYRDRALKIYPHVCARCGREFTGKRLSELTVHHKDHDHDNNPSDGSNWELLCLECHDKEHARYMDELPDDEARWREEEEPVPTYRPFASLEDLLKEKK